MDRQLTARLRVFPELSDAARALAEEIVETAGDALRTSGRFSLAISGGTTPLPLFSLLAGTFRDRVPWDRLDLFWVDERAVSPDDPRSNYGAARGILGAVWGPSSERVHRMPADTEPIASAAETYERELRAYFTRDAAPPQHTFDMALLGIGPDGHTASLFPGSPALEERERWVLPVPAPGRDPPVPRVTLTLPAINGARRAAFLVAGSDKAEAVRRARAAWTAGALGSPASRVRPSGPLTWYLDQDAAADEGPPARPM